MPKRDDDLLIGDILDCCQKIFIYTKDISFVEFINSSMTIDAVVRNYEIIGEAANLISESTRKDYPLIEFRLMADFRNLLIHEYFGVD